MEASEALELINENLIFRPEWKISARRYFWLANDEISIEVEFPAYDSSEPPDFPRVMRIAPDKVISVKDLQPLGLVYEVITFLGEIEEHEAREFLRIREGKFNDGSVAPYLAPFHPHTDAGEKLWDAAVKVDLAEVLGRLA